jgi:hypothetical protein
MTYRPDNQYDRFLDLQKQGFMRAVSKINKPKKEKKPLVMVACDFCCDWHYKGKHTASKEQRQANVAERKIKEPNYKPTQREIK